MLQKERKLGRILIVILGVVILFLTVVAVKDFAPTQTPVEKTVVYGQK